MTLTREIQASLARVELLILDVDGVLTDGKLYYGTNGVELKAFHVQDGQAIKMLQEAGVRVAVITGRTSDIVERRCRELSIAYLYQGVDDKRMALARLVEATGIDPTAMAHAGDDIPDLTLFDAVGLAFSVADAHPEVRARAHIVTSNGGGNGAVREICQLILTAQDRWSV